MSGHLTMTISRDFQHQVRRLTLEIPDRMEFETPPFPGGAWLGDEFVALQHESGAAADRLGELGYWRLNREGLAMQFLRLAWVAGWAELRAQRFDGDPRPTWQRGEG